MRTRQAATSLYASEAKAEKNAIKNCRGIPPRRQNGVVLPFSSSSISFPFCPWRQSKIWFLRMRNCFSLLFVWLERESHQKPQLTLATLYPSQPPCLPSPPRPRHCTAFGAILKIQGKFAATYFFFAQCLLAVCDFTLFLFLFSFFFYCFFAVFHIFFYFPCVFFLWLPFALAFFARWISGFYFLCRRRLLLA